MYRGRFAPSPTGALHAGSLVAALASWLDARSHQGQWLVRIEDVDVPRTVPGATERILEQLQQCGMVSDATPVRQSDRSSVYQDALNQLVQQDLAYPCHCSRKDIALALLQRGQTRPRHGELVYPGTCASGVQPRSSPFAPHSAWRFRTSAFKQNRPLTPAEQAQAAIHSVASATHWSDRRLGPQQQDVGYEVGDFVLQRADGCFTYQLAVVVDDGAQGITHVVRGEDLADNTARQILLQKALGLPTPLYLHTPLILGSNGEKLSKQNGAEAIDTATPRKALLALQQAASALGLPSSHQTDALAALQGWVPCWRSANDSN
jgi:glutamyl-Q tRNA(Asp) synthetase